MVQTVHDVIRSHRGFWKCLELTDCVLPDSISPLTSITDPDPEKRLEQDMSELTLGPARSVQRSQLVSQ